jgi:hypothetical protein
MVDGRRIWFGEFLILLAVSLGSLGKGSSNINEINSSFFRFERLTCQYRMEK